MNLKIGYLKIDVSCEAFVNFQHISQNATPATEFAPCHHWTQPWQCDLQKPRNTSPLKCCACHTKWRWTRPKCCACHENCNTSSTNDPKVLNLPHKTTFNKLWNMSECHKVPRLPRETNQRDAVETSKSDPFAELVTCERLRTVADGCERLCNVEGTHPQPPDPQSETGTLATHSEKMFHRQKALIVFCWGGHPTNFWNTV